MSGRGVCPRCRSPISTIEMVERTIVTSDEEIEAAIAGLYGDPERPHQERQVPLGVKIRLEPGFVNAKGRHVSGLPWFARGSEPSRPSPRIRPPAVVTCRCGKDVLIDPVDERSRRYATAGRKEREKQLLRDLEDEAREMFAEAEAKVRPNQ